VISPLGAIRWPQRHVVVALTFLACAIAYTDRVNIAVAAVAMREHFGWSQTEKGLVLSAFFVGYLFFMFVAGVVARRFGGKAVLGWSVLAWSVFTLLTPAAATLSMSALIAARIGMGVGEAAMFPCAFELFGRWVPPKERARATARMLSGVPLGTLIGLTGSGWLVAHLGWPAAFYAFGAAGLVWVVIWFARVENDPGADPRVSADERALLLGTSSSSLTPEKLLYTRLLLRAPVVGIVAAHFAGNWSLYLLLSWLPSYFRDVQGLSIANAGLFSAAPWFTMFAVGNLSAIVSDRLIGRGVNVTTMRKIMQCGALIVSAALLLLIRDAHSAAAALALLCGATSALGCAWSGHSPGILDVAPRHGAVLYGFSNTFATLPGVVGVALTGWLVDVTGTYSAAFVLAATVSVMGALAFGFLFDARRLVD
jgi:MFS transporter, ACS family, solute carrier family 17 (sodium-dependent inorganic phosphate cotransporter), other